ncbi:MAG: M23 family metallopeptidase [Pseudomonadota bacterium]
MRPVWLFVVCVLLMVLAAGNYAFWQYYGATQHMLHKLASAEARIESQRTQLLALAQKAQRIEDDLARVQKFDASLRLMLEVKSEVPTELDFGNVDVARSGVSHGSHGGDGSNGPNGPDGNGVPHDHDGKGNPDGHTHTDDEAVAGMYNAAQSQILSDATSLGLGTLPLHRQELLARKIHAFLDDIAHATRLEEVHQQELIVAVRAQQGVLAATPSIWPTTGKLTSRFGWRSSPTSGASTFHKGIDIARNNGAPIIAPADGTVTFVGRQSGYGNCVEIRHANGISTMYAHMKSYTVKRGQNVKRSDVIGYVGNSGRSTGPHLHYEVRVDGVPVDPMKYILN